MYGPLPEGLSKKICEQGSRLKVLELDWWAVGKEVVEKIAKRCKALERLKVTFDAPFGKLVRFLLSSFVLVKCSFLFFRAQLTLTTPFSHLSQLHTLHIIIPPIHLPLPQATNHAITPTTSPILLKSNLPHPLPCGAPSIQTLTPPSAPLDLPPPSYGSPPSILAKLEDAHQPLLDPLLWEKSVDPTVPPLKDVRKFMRRVPKLVELGWVGRSGVGFWIAGSNESHLTSPPPGAPGGGGAPVGNGHPPNGNKPHRRSSTASSTTFSFGNSTGSGGASCQVKSDVEFLSLALLWKDEWEEAGKGNPAWCLEEHEMGSPVNGSGVRRRSSLSDWGESVLSQRLFVGARLN